MALPASSAAPCGLEGMMVLPVPARPTPRGPNGLHPPRAHSAPVTLYTQVSAQLPLTGAQAQAVVPSSGTVTLQVSPTGMGTVWYPASAVVALTPVPVALVTCSVYLGPLNTPVALQGVVQSGGTGVVSLAIPALSPGLAIIAVWTGAGEGLTASLNVSGTMTALVPRS